MPPLKRRSSKKSRATPLRRWRLIFQRSFQIGRILLISGGVIGAGLWSVNHGSRWLYQTLYRIGFRVDEVWVEGREKTPLDLLRQTVGLRQGDDIFSQTPCAIKERLEALPWVCAAVVSRQLPGTMHIYIAERKPLALWQKGESDVLVDSQGEIIPCASTEYPPMLLKIVGDRAPQETPSLLKVLQQFPTLHPRVVTAVHLRSGRWDLHLRNQCVIRLPCMTPPKFPFQALQRFLDIEGHNKKLTESYERIDLRFANRMILRPYKRSPGNRTAQRLQTS